MNPITVIICDDHPIFRQGLISILDKDNSIKFLADCADGETALRKIKDLQPEIAVLDIAMPEPDGLAITRTVQNLNLSTRCIILTMYKDEEYFSEAMDAGAMGYLLKENAGADLLACIKAVAQGRFYVSSLLSDLLLNREKQKTALQNNQPQMNTLTETELKIMRLIAQNKTSKEIAAELFISHRTVQNHRQHISDKLNLHGPHALLKFALEHKSLL